MRDIIRIAMDIKNRPLVLDLVKQCANRGVNNVLSYYTQELCDGGYRLKLSLAQDADIVSADALDTEVVYELPPGVKHHVSIESLTYLFPGEENVDALHVLKYRAADIMNELIRL